MKIRTRLFLVALLPVFFLLGTSIIQYQFSSVVDRFNRNVIAVDELERNFSDLSILTHEHFLYGAERTKAQWGRKYEEIGATIRGVAPLLGSSEEKGLIAEIEKRYETLGYLFGQYETPGQNAASPQEYAGNKSFADRISNRILQELELVRFSLAQIHDINHTGVTVSEERKDRAGILFLVAMALFIPAISWRIYRDFATPMEKLQEGIRIIGAGNSDHRIGLTQKDEIGELSAAFDEMNQRRKIADDLILMANAELEARVKARTLELTQAVESLAQEVKERVAAEKELSDLNRTLEQRVETEMRHRLENERMLIQQSRLAAMGEMIGSIAHQWRQPLNAVSAIVQDVRDAYACQALNESYLNRSVDGAMDNIRFMSKTIDDFRNFFRPDKEKVAFDIKQAAAEVLRMVAPQLKALHIECSLTCLVHDKTFTDFADPVTSCGEMTVTGYENESKQVFLNLLTNARDAILERRNRQGDSSLPGRITMTFDNRGDRVFIRVADNGCGIPEDILGLIFDPYFTTKDASRGTGLGLYMCKMIVEKNMGGALSARNVNGSAEIKIEV